jgi:hypothetical protein
MRRYLSKKKAAIQPVLRAVDLLRVRQPKRAETMQQKHKEIYHNASRRKRKLKHTMVDSIILAPAGGGQY